METTTSTQEHYANLAKQHQLNFVRLNAYNIDLDLLHQADCSKYIALQAIPIAREQQTYTVALSHPEYIPLIHQKWGIDTKLVVTPLQDITTLLSEQFEKEYLRDITFKLYENTPELSAKHTFSLSEKIIFFTIFIALFVAIPFFGDIRSELMLNIFLTAGTLAIWIYKFILCLVGISIPTLYYAKRYSFRDKDLPFYTILVPLFHEQSKTIAQLITALERFDYPHEKLDIKFLLEADDIQTLLTVQKSNLPFNVQILKVPTGQPRTKPRACNYGLEFAIGEYITIFDAEDKPDPDQLKAALYTFQTGDPKLVCVQCPLNYYNRHENFLTRLFSLEYTFWFDVQLPALNQLKLPIPLGGTSNHFRTDFLRKIGGWDPFNVTEDADLGIRIHSLGGKVGMAYSTTYEEANCKVGNWLLQRSRWIKGYMQTYLVHMRNPLKLFKNLGWHGFISFQFLIGGTIFSALANLFLWVVFIATWLLPTHYTHSLFTPTLLHIAWFNFIAGNILLVGVHLIAACRRRLYTLALSAFLLPVYWILMSIASYISLYELIVRPSYWHKTTHGISKYIPEITDNM